LEWIAKIHILSKDRYQANVISKKKGLGRSEGDWRKK